MHNEIPLFQKIYDFYKLFYSYIDDFPKKSRPVLGQRIEQIILDLLESISSASYASQSKKINLLKQASNKADFLKILFRLAYELRIIDQKKYFLLEQKLLEIGRMIGGWLKSSKNTSRSS